MLKLTFVNNNVISNKNKASIYIHWPFCESKCPYCDFNSYVANDIDYDLWLKSLTQELHYYKNYLSNKQVVSIFFGGGTPSLAPEFIIGELINKMSKEFTLLPNIEITMEANPSSSEAGKFKNIALAGVNRLSLGIQSLRDDNLKFLGRLHSVEQAKHAIEIAKQNFKRYSFDLIYALPNQSINDWQNELKQALSIANGHLSLYQLTIEKGTKFYKAHQMKEFTLPNEELAADLYMATENIMNAHKYTSYEVSNYAQPNNECMHNLQYWNGSDYLGIGPGAHSRITIDNVRYAINNVYNPQDWLNKVNSENHGTQSKQVLNKQDITIEKILMGLRTIYGVDASEFNQIKLDQMLSAGFLKIKQGMVVATPQGRLILNSIIANII